MLDLYRLAPPELFLLTIKGCRGARKSAYVVFVYACADPMLHQGTLRFHGLRLPHNRHKHNHFAES